MTRAEKLALWAAAMFVVASCFIESGAYITVAVFAVAGAGFWLWSARVEKRTR